MAQGKHTPGPLFIGSEHETNDPDRPQYRDNDMTGWPYYIHTAPKTGGNYHPATGIQDEDDARLFAAAPDLLEACQQITAAHDNGWRILDAISLARNAAAKATGTHAETSAPDDPTQHNAVTADGKPKLCPHCYQPTPAAQAMERHIADAQQDMPLPDLLAAILRRAERARSYGRLMLSTKDNCLDDVIRLATRALLQANDKVQP